MCVCIYTCTLYDCVCTCVCTAGESELQPDLQYIVEEDNEVFRQEIAEYDARKEREKLKVGTVIHCSTSRRYSYTCTCTCI